MNNWFFRPAVMGLVLCFYLAIGFGYMVAFGNILITEQHIPDGIRKNITGLTEVEMENADEISLGKSSNDLAVTTHTHVFSLSVIFLIVGMLSYIYLPYRWIRYVIPEPFISLILTFGSLWMVYLGFWGFRYLAFISGVIMHLSFSILIITNLIVLSINLKKIWKNESLARR